MEREMRDSGIEWIGKIPYDWKDGKIGQLYSERKEKVSDRNYEPLSVTMQGIVPQLSTAAKSDAHDDRKLVRKGDFAINSRSDRRGSCGISDYDGSVSLINTILKPRESMNPEYYNWLFHTTMFADEFYKWGHGIVDDLWTTNWSEMKSICIPTPPLFEQQRIASFLDTKCAEIDKAIEATKSSIEEYKKLRQAIITEAVTKGLDPNVEMKRIDNPWIESIPNHCSFSRVGLHFNIILGKMITSNPDSKNNVLAQYVCAANVHFDGVDLSNLKQMWFSENEIEQYAIKNGDLLVVEGGAGAGGCAIVNNIDAKIGIQNSIMIIRGDKGNVVRYLSYLLYSLVNRNYIDIVCNRATIPHFTKDKLENTPYIVFPESEQIAIADYLDTRCAQINSLIKSKEKLIEELTAYRRSLIYEYVTGKKEVPAV